MEAPQQIHADNELCAQCEWTGMAQTVQIDIVLLRDGRHRRTFQRCSPFSAVEENICESGKSTFGIVIRATKSSDTSNEIMSMAFSYRWSDQRRNFILINCNLTVSSSWRACHGRTSGKANRRLLALYPYHPRLLTQNMWEELFSQSAHIVRQWGRQYRRRRRCCERVPILILSISPSALGPPTLCSTRHYPNKSHGWHAVRRAFAVTLLFNTFTHRGAFLQRIEQMSNKLRKFMGK